MSKSDKPRRGKYPEYRGIICNAVHIDAVEKLRVLCRFANQPMVDLVNHILEMGIDAAWEGYRRNPKHAHQIKAYEDKRKERSCRSN